MFYLLVSESDREDITSGEVISGINKQRLTQALCECCLCGLDWVGVYRIETSEPVLDGDVEVICDVYNAPTLLKYSNTKLQLDLKKLKNVDIKLIASSDSGSYPTLTF